MGFTDGEAKGVFGLGGSRVVDRANGLGVVGGLEGGLGWGLGGWGGEDGREDSDSE